MSGNPASLARRGRWSREIVFLALVAVYSALAGWFKANDNDFFWHLKAGQEMLASGTILRSNTFSAIFPGYHWENPEWLFQVLLAAVHRVGGWLGMHAVKVSICAGIGIMLYTVCRGRGAAPTISAAIAAGAVTVMRFRFTERPDFISVALFCLTALAVDNFRRAPSKRIWWLVPLFAVWSNLHPGLLFALAYLVGIALVEMVLGKTAFGDFRRGKELVLLGAACALASLANPFGYKVLLYPFLTRDLLSVVDVVEFARPTVGGMPAFYLMSALALAAFVGARKRDLPQITIALFFLLLAMQYLRIIPYAVISSVGLIAASTVESVGGPAVRKTLAASCVIVLAFSAGWSFSGRDTSYHFAFGYGLDETGYPAGAADFAMREELPGTIYNHYGTGGYLAYRLFPRYGVFQDGRIPAYPIDFLKQFQIGHSEADWTANFIKYRVNTVIDLTENTPLLIRDRENWAFVYWDDKYSVLVRKSAVSTAFLSRVEYRYYQPWNDLSTLITESNVAAVESEVRRNMRDSPKPFWLNYTGLANLALRRGNLQEAEKLLTAAQALISDTNFSGMADLGYSWLQAGRKEKAVAALKKSLQINPGQPEVIQALAIITGSPPP